MIVGITIILIILIFALISVYNLYFYNDNTHSRKNPYILPNQRYVLSASYLAGLAITTLMFLWFSCWLPVSYIVYVVLATTIIAVTMYYVISIIYGLNDNTESVVTASRSTTYDNTQCHVSFSNERSHSNNPDDAGSDVSPNVTYNYFDPF